MNHQPPGGAAWKPDLQTDPPRFEAGLLHQRDDLRVRLGEMFAVARRSAVWVLLWILTCLTVACIYLYRTSPEFIASAQVVLEPRRQVSAGGAEAAMASLGPTLDGAQAESQVQVVKSERNLRFVFDSLNLVDSYAEPSLPQTEPDQLRRALAFQNFVSRVGVARIGQSYVLDISFRATSPTEAARLANAIAASYIRDQIQFRAASAQRGTEFLQGRISNIASELTAATAAVNSGVIPDVQFVDADARVVSAALPPLGKSYPQSKLIVAFAAVFALMSTFAYVLIRHSLDRTVRTRGQISRALGIDCLSVLPRLRSKALKRGDRANLRFDSVIDAPHSDFARMLRVLRAGLFSAGVVPRKMVVGIVSCSPREGSSSVAANLAFLLSASAEPTLLIDCDVRKPTLTLALAPHADTGLNEALLSHGITRQLPMIQIGPDLALVPAVGSGCEADPNVFVGSGKMRERLLQARADRNVIIDLPSLSESSDAQAIGHMLDGVVLIVEAFRTTLDDVAEAVRALKAAEVRLLGIALNKAPAGSRRS